MIVSNLKCSSDYLKCGRRTGIWCLIFQGKAILAVILGENFIYLCTECKWQLARDWWLAQKPEIIQFLWQCARISRHAFIRRVVYTPLWRLCITGHHDVSLHDCSKEQQRWKREREQARWENKNKSESTGLRIERSELFTDVLASVSSLTFVYYGLMEMM